MSRQFLPFQSVCIFLIASSAYRAGGQLPEKITSQYLYCYELSRFTTNPPTPTFQEPFVIDNLCMDLEGLTYHFLSSAEGGTTSFIVAPKAGITVVHLKSNSIGFKFDWLSEPVLSAVCRLQDAEQALHVYYDIYLFRLLTRQDVVVSRAKYFLLDPTGSEIVDRSEFPPQSRLYTEFYSSMEMVLTFQEESADGDAGDPFLILLATKYNISDVPVNNNVLLRLNGYTIMYIILTFDDEPKANNFCNSFRSQFNANDAMPIPPAVLKEIL